MSELQLGDRPEGYRSGFCSIVGRPNVGKSTFMNQTLRAKVSIATDRPQTTRNAIRGVLTTSQAQVVFVDTPGLHKPRTTLGEKLNQVVRTSLREMDAIVFMLDASQPIGRGDAFLASTLAGVTTPIVAALNKIDLCDAAHAAAQAEVVRRLAGERPFAAVVPMSARSGEGVQSVVAAVVAALPEGPLYYPPDMVTDQPERILMAELVREKVMELTREEVPHSVAVVVHEVEMDEELDRLEVDVAIYVERDSQKGILIGRGGTMLKEIGSRARKDIEALLGSRVYLRLRVKVEPNWQRRAGMISRFGYGT